MAQIITILFSRHCNRLIFLPSRHREGRHLVQWRQWRDGAKSCASAHTAQHCSRVLTIHILCAVLSALPLVYLFLSLYEFDNEVYTCYVGDTLYECTGHPVQFYRVNIAGMSKLNHYGHSFSALFQFFKSKII